MQQVVRNLHSLGRVAQRLPTFDGPQLGAKLATRNERSFTSEQLAQARAMPTRLVREQAAAGLVSASMKESPSASATRARAMSCHELSPLPAPSTSQSVSHVAACHVHVPSAPPSIATLPMAHDAAHAPPHGHRGAAGSVTIEATHEAINAPLAAASDLTSDHGSTASTSLASSSCEGSLPNPREKTQPIAPPVTQPVTPTAATADSCTAGPSPYSLAAVAAQRQVQRSISFATPSGRAKRSEATMDTRTPGRAANMDDSCVAQSGALADSTEAAAGGAGRGTDARTEERTEESTEEGTEESMEGLDADALLAMRVRRDAEAWAARVAAKVAARQLHGAAKAAGAPATADDALVDRTDKAVDTVRGVEDTGVDGAPRVDARADGRIDEMRIALAAKDQTIAQLTGELQRARTMISRLERQQSRKSARAIRRHYGVC